MEECSYLEHVVGGGKVRVEESKIEATRKIQRLMTKKDVRAVLGLTGYYRKFIPNYSTIAVSLTDLTRKAQPCQVICTLDCEEAFRKLKDLLCSSPVLQVQDFKTSFVLQTDASYRCLRPRSGRGLEPAGQRWYGQTSSLF